MKTTTSVTSACDYFICSLKLCQLWLKIQIVHIADLLHKTLYVLSRLAFCIRSFWPNGKTVSGPGAILWIKEWNDTCVPLPPLPTDWGFIRFNTAPKEKKKKKKADRHQAAAPFKSRHLICWQLKRRLWLRATSSLTKSRPIKMTSPFFSRATPNGRRLRLDAIHCHSPVSAEGFRGAARAARGAWMDIWYSSSLLFWP